MNGQQFAMKKVLFWRNGTVSLWNLLMVLNRRETFGKITEITGIQWEDMYAHEMKKIRLNSKIVTKVLNIDQNSSSPNAHVILIPQKLKKFLER